MMIFSLNVKEIEDIVAVQNFSSVILIMIGGRGERIMQRERKEGSEKRCSYDISYATTYRT
jgi:hypothetical protein